MIITPVYHYSEIGFMDITQQLLNKTPRQRLVHALAFEGLALFICAPVLAWVMDRPLLQMGALTLMVSLVAMLWNMLFNWLFDRAQLRYGFHRGLWARISHAGLFELGLLFTIVPLAAWWLSISLWEAFLLDIGLLLFFLPYTLVFNWTYDQLLARQIRRSQCLA